MYFFIKKVTIVDERREIGCICREDDLSDKCILDKF